MKQPPSPFPAQLTRAAAIIALLSLFSVAPPSAAEDLARSSRGSERIVGGEEAVAGQYPWVVSIRRRIDGEPVHWCGGSLISPNLDEEGFVPDAPWRNKDVTARWVLTAAHCVTDVDGRVLDASEFEVQSATVDISGTGAAPSLVQPVERVLKHPDYQVSDNSFDFALLRLPEGDRAELMLDGITDHLRRPIRLPDSRDGRWINRPYTALTVAGWGRTSEGGFVSKRLKRVMVPLVDADTCRSAYGDIGVNIWPDMICAGFETGGFDACQGDSGGPLFYSPIRRQLALSQVKDPVLAGVVSWGEGCARGGGMFGVYARVIYATSWIESAILSDMEQEATPSEAGCKDPPCSHHFEPADGS